MNVMWAIQLSLLSRSAILAGDTPAIKPAAHIPPEWPARAIVWLCGPDGAEFAGEEVKLREDEARRRIGLI